MLHVKHPTRRSGCTLVSHSKEFRAEEKQFPNLTAPAVSSTASPASSSDYSEGNLLRERNSANSGGAAAESGEAHLMQKSHKARVGAYVVKIGSTPMSEILGS